MQQGTVPVEHLRAAGFGDEVEKVATAVAEYLDTGTGANVAIVSEPYAGRDALLEYAASLLDGEAVHVQLTPAAADGTGPALPESVGDLPGERGADVEPGPDQARANGGRADTDADGDDAGTDADADDAAAGALLAADCHYLFERRIDGFEALDAFLDRIALSDALVVTTWNRYAWSYLDGVRDVGDSFSTQVEIPRLDAGEIRTVVESRYGPDLPDVVDSGHAGRVKTVVFDHLTAGLPGGRSLAIPYPKPNPAWLASWSVSGTEESVEAVVFEKLRRVSNGNPGVALEVWAESIRDGEIAPGYVEAFDTDLALDDDAVVLLWTVVAMESIGIDRLNALFADRPVESALHGLVGRGLVTVSDGTVAVAPRALHLAVAALERRGLLW